MSEAATKDRNEAAPPPRAAVVERVDVKAVNKTQERVLYQKRVKIHPKRTRGYFRRLKWILMALFLAIYYLLPWVRWDRGPNAPDQAVLLDIPARRFYFFFIEIWPQEIYYVTGILILAAVGLFLVTSLAGRVWCGYACPQTVWTDLFLSVERWVEGDRGARIRLDKMPWGASKIAKKLVKHGIWILIGMATGGAWVFYFADAPTLLVNLVTLEAPPVAYITVAILTFTTYLFGGFAREQVCIYMCPWPRIQGAMLDEHSWVVTYHDHRGEPRGPLKKGVVQEGKGDCIACNQCVVVCPMGIDIRDGMQLECITCALCIDACDSVMAKIGKPPGLISYSTPAVMDAQDHGQHPKPKYIRPRTLLYLSFIFGVGLIMLVALGTRDTIDLNVLRDRNPLFVTLSNGDIRNGYTVKIINKAHEERQFEIHLEGLPEASLAILGRPEGSPAVVPVKADSLESYRVFVAAPRETLTSQATDVSFLVRARPGEKTEVEEARNDTTFRGPAR